MFKFLIMCVLLLKNNIITSKYKLKPKKISTLIFVTQLINSRCFIQAQGSMILTKTHRSTVTLICIIISKLFVNLSNMTIQHGLSLKEEPCEHFLGG